ncbi:actin family [Catenaria anguillulae PL171]|uniref:Actin family n=1 Tax=Catenaria anguillulae PL171 TaxID=765915 RepID=A0A1Y2HGX7_9FUNG|nr:actin family [Catenaria anguillulae PL171]
MSATYGGDEVNALVLDVGTSYTKAGYSGEDMPDAYFPTQMGYLPPDDAAMDIDTDVNSNGANSKRKKNSWFAGDNGANVWRSDMEVRSPLTDGLVTDWDAFEHLLDHTFRTHLRLNPADHPLLMTEPAWNPKATREKMCELAFETYDFPAFFLAKNPVLAAFAAGKGSALVVECGGGTTSVVPVFEGYVMNKAMAHQALAGDFLSHQALLTFQWNKIDILPQYLIQDKQAVAMGSPAIVTKRDRQGVTTDSFHYNALMRTFDDFKQSVAAVSETQLNEEAYNNSADLTTTLGKPYEFACGYNNTFTLERLRLSEVLFQPTKYIIPPDALPSSNKPAAAFRFPAGMSGTKDVKSIPQMLRHAYEHLDVDVRPALLTSVVCTGGSAQMPGFGARIEAELAAIQPGGKVKITAGAANSLPERKCGAWLGGSILTSIGNFHSLWISKKEYEEHGRSIVEKKCV